CWRRSCAKPAAMSRNARAVWALTVRPSIGGCGGWASPGGIDAAACPPGSVRRADPDQAFHCLPRGGIVPRGEGAADILQRLDIGDHCAGIDPATGDQRDGLIEILRLIDAGADQLQLSP